MTPGRFRIGDFGADLSGITDAGLASILQTSTAMVNGYCTVPTIPVEYDFRGGTITGEETAWELGHELLPGQRRVLPRFTPVIEVTELRIDVTGSQYLGFSNDQLYVTDGSVEIIAPTTTVGMFGTAIVPAIGLIPPIARTSYTYGHRFSARGEELYPSDAKEFRAFHQWWWDDPEPAIYVDGTEVATADYTLDLDEGTVTFDDNLSADAVVTADFDYRLPDAIAESTALVGLQRLGERNLTAKGLHGMIELAVGDVRIRRDFPRAGVARHGVSDEVMQLLDPYRFVTVAGS
jgi:hypothetical protein